MADQIDLSIVRGDTAVYKVGPFQDETNTLIDDPGAEYRMTAKVSISDADVAAVFSVTASQSSPGIAFITVPPSATRSQPAQNTDLVYDVQVTETSGRITTLQYGTFTVIPDVSITSP